MAVVCLCRRPQRRSEPVTKEGVTIVAWRHQRQHQHHQGAQHGSSRLARASLITSCLELLWLCHRQDNTDSDKLRSRQRTELYADGRF